MMTGEIVGMKEAGAIIDFWFEQTEPKHWFSKDVAFDATIENRFGGCVRRALKGGPIDGTQDAQACLASVLLLDQFTRHIYRESAHAFSGDVKALGLSLLAVEKGWVAGDKNLNHRRFYLMPMMHSEDLAVQRASLALFANHTDENTLRYAQRHLDIIERFGRFPHRNQVMGRQSTPEEIDFLTMPGSSF
jgi:uncharacterized protein (DUF924 family)